MGVGDASTRRIRFYGGHLLPSLFGDAVMSDWEQELVDFINAKAKEHADMPMNKLGYFNLMAQLARHQVNHVEAKLRSQYWNHNQPTDYLINPTLEEEDQ